MKSYLHSLSAAAASSTFKNADGLLNFDAVFNLQKRIEDILKAAEKAGKVIKPAGHYVIAAKAKPIKYSAASEKKDDLRYHTRRATKIATRKIIKPANLAKVKVLLTLVSGPDVPAALATKIKEATRAIEAHLKKIVKVKDVIAKKKGKIRDVNAKEFETALGHLAKVLEAGGVKETDIVESTGMFGKSMLVKVGPGSVISIGKSDMARFNAAKKAAKASV